MTTYDSLWKSQIIQEPQAVVDQATVLLSSEENTLEEQAELHYWVALSHRYLTKMDQCLHHAYESEYRYEKLSDIDGLAKVTNLIGVVYFYNGYYEKAIRYFFTAKDLAQQQQNFPTLCRIENNIGEVYRETEEFGLSELHYQQALDYAKQSEEPYFQAIILENLGQLSYHHDELEKAECYLFESRALLQTLHDRSALADVENKLGLVFMKRGQVDRAEEHFRMAFQQIQPDGNQLYLTEILMNLAELLSEYDQSYLELLQEAEKSAVSIEAHHLLKKIYQRLSSYFEERQDYKTALSYYKLVHQTEQIVESSSMRTKLELLRVEVNHSQDLNKMSALNEQLSYEINQLNEEVYMDELTKVKNRKGLHQYLASSQAATYLLALLDIDHFKIFNDSHGHLAGDHALHQVAQALLRAVTTASYEACVARLGGEEFIVIVPVLQGTDVQKILTEIQREIQVLKLPYSEDNKAQVVTVSGGALVTSEDVNEHFMELYKKMDELLYQVKQNGRNQILLQQFRQN
ncbi:hypothetical protein CQS04_12660 [Chryseomicrobium excrementi]|uniref:GGDEF domain-containing protein n=1 Tax=Chryseomicrobium excrementi TaxID=2041346 RepID=A0A2M9EWX2_9BACL|nr:diguanylate cyclase [Chryseomicrobium excrementi]PJK15702.1 hypothetical protein CQS04_12660 [Chryseomicrobium excrementi]